MKVGCLAQEPNTHCVERAHRSELDLSDKTQLARHPHNSFFAYLGPTAREFAVNAAYRLCERKKVRKDRSQVTECHRCKHGISEWYKNKILD